MNSRWRRQSNASPGGPAAIVLESPHISIGTSSIVKSSRTIPAARPDDRTD